MGGREKTNSWPWTVQVRGKGTDKDREELRWSSGRKKSRAGSRDGGRDSETELLRSQPTGEGVSEWLGARSRSRCWGTWPHESRG